MTISLKTPTEIPEGVKTYGPLTDYEYVPTDYGIYGLESGTVMWFEPVTEFDQKEQRMVENWYPQRFRVTPHAGPMDPAFHQKVARKANLENYRTGRPSEFGQTEDTAGALRELAASISALVAQNTGTPLAENQLVKNLEDIVSEPDVDITELVEIAKAMKIDDEEES